MHRFYWMIPNVIAGCSRPGGIRGDLDGDLATLRGHGIGALVTLTETPLPQGALARYGLLGLHLPVDDFQAPTTPQLLEAIAFLDDARASSTPVAVHCLAGQGRTGTILAAYLIRDGLSADDAIADVRKVCANAIESPPQTAALARWAAERPWIV